MAVLSDFFFTGHHDWGPEGWSAAAGGTGVTVHQLPQPNPSLLPDISRGLPFLVWVYNDPESGQTQGAHLCPTRAMNDFMKNKAISKEIKKIIFKQQKMPLSSVNFPVPAILQSETGDG